jgi:hypothetical protein
MQSASRTSPGLSIITEDNCGNFNENTVHATSLPKNKGKEVMVHNQFEVLEELNDNTIHQKPATIIDKDDNSLPSCNKRPHRQSDPTIIDMVTAGLEDTDLATPQNHLLQPVEEGYSSAPEVSNRELKNDKKIKIRSDWRYLEVPKTLLDETSTITRSKSKASRNSK